MGIMHIRQSGHFDHPVQRRPDGRTSIIAWPSIGMDAQLTMLSTIERDVASQLADGLSLLDIQELLELSDTRAAASVAEIFRKLRVERRRELAAAMECLEIQDRFLSN